MEDLLDSLISHHIEEWSEIDPLGQRIDDRFNARRRSLNQTQLRPIGRLPHELGVDSDKGLIAQATAVG